MWDLEKLLKGKFGASSKYGGLLTSMADFWNVRQI